MADGMLHENWNCKYFYGPECNLNRIELHEHEFLSDRCTLYGKYSNVDSGKKGIRPLLT